MRRSRLRASSVCEAEGHLLVVRLRDPASGEEAWYPPGGGIEAGETPADAARRETLEEAGVRIDVDAESALVETYPFRWNAIDYDVTTHFFFATLAEGQAFARELPSVVDADYHRGARWMPVLEALDAMAVHPAIAAPVARVLNRRHRAEWQRHPHRGGPAGTLLAIHDRFREAARRMRMDDDARIFRALAEVLHHHHHAEEAMLFPFVARRTGKAPERLVDDHTELTRAIAHAEDEPSPDAFARFVRVLEAHLDREELEIVPLLLAVDPREAWALIEGA